MRASKQTGGGFWDTVAQYVTGIGDDSASVGRSARAYAFYNILRNHYPDDLDSLVEFANTHDTADPRIIRVDHGARRAAFHMPSLSHLMNPMAYGAEVLRRNVAGPVLYRLAMEADPQLTVDVINIANRDAGRFPPTQTPGRIAEGREAPIGGTPFAFAGAIAGPAEAEPSEPFAGAIARPADVPSTATAQTQTDTIQHPEGHADNPIMIDENDTDEYSDADTDPMDASDDDNHFPPNPNLGIGGGGRSGASMFGSGFSGSLSREYTKKPYARIRHYLKVGAGIGGALAAGAAWGAIEHLAAQDTPELREQRHRRSRRRQVQRGGGLDAPTRASAAETPRLNEAGLYIDPELEMTTTAEERWRELELAHKLKEKVELAQYKALPKIVINTTRGPKSAGKRSKLLEEIKMSIMKKTYGNEWARPQKKKRRRHK